MAVSASTDLFDAMAADPSRAELFEVVVAQYTGLISRIALSCERDTAIRRELIQDIMLAIWLALPSFRGDASLKTFVASIAQKRSITHIARRAREPRQVELSLEMQSDEPDPGEQAMRNEQRRQLVAAIQTLPVPQREAIVLSLEGFSFAEIGEVLGITANAAMLRCQRAKTTLKKLMRRGG